VSATGLVLRLIEVLDGLAIPYMLVGSYSSNYYGRPRSTLDADFVVVLEKDQLNSVRDALGADFQLDPQMSFESVTMTTRHVITHPASAFKLELFLLTGDPHDQARFSRRQKVEFENHSAWLPTAEDVIIQKLRWSRGGKRAKDLSDANDVLRMQRPRLDIEYIRKWTAQHQTIDLFEDLLSKLDHREETS
jgi:hypothetical protein